MKERGRRAVLRRGQVSEIFKYLLMAKSPNNRQIEKRIDAAETKLAKDLNLNPRMDSNNNVTWSDPPEIDEYWFSEYELFGIKVAFVQAIKGSVTRPPVTHGHKKYFLFPILKELGILLAIEKETSDGDKSDDYSVVFDGEEDLKEDVDPEGNGQESEDRQENPASEKAE